MYGPVLRPAHIPTYGAGSKYVPRRMPNLALWLKAGQRTTTRDDAGTLFATSWGGLSGNGHVATQATEANQPQLIADAVNGKPAVRFDGTNDGLEAPAGTSLDNMWVGGGYAAFVFNVAVGANGTLISKEVSDVAGWRLFTNSATPSFAPVMKVGFSGGAGQWATDSNAISMGEWHIFEIIYDADDAANVPTFVLDGTETGMFSTQPTGTVNDDSGNDFFLGIRPGGFEPLEHDSPEVLLCSAIPSSAARASIREYFANRYEITVA